MITWTYEPLGAEEYSPIRKITFELEDSCLWSEYIGPFNDFLAALGYIPPELGVFVKHVQEE